MSIRVARAEPGDKEQLMEFIRKAYGSIADLKIPERWQWEFSANPYCEAGKLPVWVAWDDGKIVGQTCAMPVPLQIGSRTITAAWSVDTIVLPEYQGKGIGTLLQKANAGSHQAFMSLSMSRANRYVKKKFGSIPLAPVVVYRRYIRFSAAFLRAYLLFRTRNHAPLHKTVKLICRLCKMHWLLLPFLNGFFFMRNAIKGSIRRLGLQDYRILEIDAFDARADALWEQTHHRYPVAVKRESRYLNWKFAQQPGLGYRMFYLEEGSAVTGYMVLRKPHPREMNRGVIAELYAARDRQPALTALLSYALRFFGKEPAWIEVAASLPEYQSVIKRLFVKNEAIVPMFHTQDSSLDLDLIVQPEAWFLDKGDHDWDQIVPGSDVYKTYR